MFLSPLPFSSLKSPSLRESDQNPHQSILFSIRTLALSIPPPLPENTHLECFNVRNQGKLAMRSEDGNLEAVQRDLEALLIENQDQEQDQVGSDRSFFNIHRSGSAPPTVDGSMRAIGGLRAIPFLGEAGALLTDEDFRSNPAYLDYLYSTESCNPRLPPRMSWDDSRATQRFGGVGDLRSVGDVDGSSSSLFSLQPGASARDQGTQGRMNGQWSSVQNAASFERGNNNLSGLTGVGLGARRKSFADVLQEELCQPTALPHFSLSTGQNTLQKFSNPTSITNNQIGMHQNLESSDSLRSSGAYSGLHRIQSFGSSASHSPSGRASSFTRSQTPDPQLIRRSPSPCLPPIGARSVTPTNGVSASSNGHGDITGALSGLNLTKSRSVGGGNHSDSLYQELSDHSEFQFDVSNNKNPYQQPSFINASPARPISSPSNPMLMAYDLSKKNGFPPDQYTSKVTRNDKGYLLKSSSSNDMYNKASSVHFTGYNGYHSAQPSNMDFAENDIRNFAMNQRLPELINNQFDADAISFGATDGKYRRGNQGGNGFESSLLDPLFMQYFGKADLATQPGLTFADSGGGRSYADASALELSAYQKAYLETVLAQQNLQHGMPYLGKSASFDHGYYDSAAYGLGLPYSGSTLSPSNPGNLLRSERFLRYPSSVKNAVGGSLGSLIPDNGLKEPGLSTFLEEFKSSKNRNFELSEIAGHIVEFSADQYGSRFIQQKLETASVEEKNMIFPEILPRARTLMTDVFGNYVIQKFFEHGTESQRSQLANQLINHVLPLSLQMYGCRVIQKALEVVDVDLQTQMVSELDGSVIKCVRDQNGNHVIQKCIELVPQEKIQFIITTFYGQVVTLSTHPYGCRVIQRVLEHCDDAETQRIMMGEILQSVCTLALDQYGNYVVQHVLQHGKPEERTAIISTLAGQIVKMSQQKFASNVVEKCLTFGSPDERQLLINEMLGSTDENEPLQAMMKDQFGNYVVQKVLEICDDQNRELILSRIKVHLNALKRYTYGKHIVARVEKLITAGERRIGILSYSS